MKIVKSAQEDEARCESIDTSTIPREITARDLEIFDRIISTTLNTTQRKQIVEPMTIYPKQEHVLAVHWHPEFVPMDLIVKRIDTMFPNRKTELLVPTQHNVLMSLNGYTGVEVDCYSSGFNRKVQLLLHFKEENVQDADTLRAMLSHTFQYRSSQLFDFMHSVVSPDMEERAQKAAAKSNTDAGVVEFVRLYTLKIQKMLEDNWSRVPRESVKNKLLRNFFDELRTDYGEGLINKAQVFLKAVKVIVKSHFSLKFFYRASEIIEEARTHGAGIIIPHPEQFWPILLAGYDVDAIEVWNPQSREYTEFLINAVNDRNRTRNTSERPVLISMGDDCHMGEKTKAPQHQNKQKAAREIGLQPAWDDLAVRKSLIRNNISRSKFIQEYKARLG
ncbi:MAG: hypothetical protein ACNI3A_12240 [Desulfovibrio sp.]|uniref:hypothetical protein n=1 Tax=Desulfovibrio sp. 7SRBS1 TaxID=3378064 RepID=UPI003B400C75